MRVNANLPSRIKLIWAVQSARKKYCCFRWRQITGLFALSRLTRGAFAQSSVNARRGAVDAMHQAQFLRGRMMRRVRLSRVVLTPGMLASSPWEANASRGRWWQEAPIHQGEHDINRRATAQGRPECFR